MTEAVCKVCTSREFYVKDPDDAWKTYHFRKRGSDIEWLLKDGQDGPPELTAGTEVFCATCAWHGKLAETG